MPPLAPQLTLLPHCSQDASLRLYLCVLLRRSPRVAQAVVMGLNGQRFLDIYIPSLGLELRIQTEEIVPGPVLADWDAVARCVQSLPL